MIRAHAVLKTTPPEVAPASHLTWVTYAISAQAKKRELLIATKQPASAQSYGLEVFLYVECTREM